MDERKLGVRILANLSGVHEDMLALVDIIWDGINPHDANGREVGNGQVEILDKQLRVMAGVTSEIANLLKVRVGLFDEELPGNKPGVLTAPTDLIFAGRSAHTIKEDLTSSKPVGFILQGRAVKNVTDWAEVYLAVCKELAGRNPTRFDALADNVNFMTNQRKLIFSRQPQKFNLAKPIVRDIHAELNLSVRSICSRLRKLFDEFGIPHDAMQIYLR